MISDVQSLGLQTIATRNLKCEDIKFTVLALGATPRFELLDTTPTISSRDPPLPPGQLETHVVLYYNVY